MRGSTNQTNVKRITTTTTATNDGKAKQHSQTVICVNGVCHVSPRGGGQSSQEEEEYDYDDEEEEEEQVLPPRKKSQPLQAKRSNHPPRRPPTTTTASGQQQRQATSLQRSPSRRGPPPPPPPRRRPRPSALSSAASLAKKTVDLTTSAAVTTLRGSGKAAFYLVSPKHVSRRDVWGIWRLDQQIGTDGPSVSCAANVELTPPGDVITKYENQVFETTYSFRERSWPQSCSIEFEARAFQGPNDDEPVLMRYKGYFRRKLADPKVIKIVGTIYQVRKKGGLWRGGGGSDRKVGTFVARRRLVARPEETEQDDYDDYDDDEYDDEDLENDDVMRNLDDEQSNDEADLEDDAYDEED